MKKPECVRPQSEKQYVITSLEVGIYQYKCWEDSDYKRVFFYWFEVSNTFFKYL